MEEQLFTLLPVVRMRIPADVSEMRSIRLDPAMRVLQDKIFQQIRLEMDLRIEAPELKEEFLDVLFGDSVPDEIKDFCFWVDVVPINGTISVDQTVKIGGQSYKITTVGSEAPTTLAGLGHCAFNFSGQLEMDLLGTIYVENRPLPERKAGTVIQIIEE